MGCIFEAAREQPQQKTKQQSRNQCGAITRTTTATTIGALSSADEIQIKDNYQQNHKTQTTNGKHLKATAQVLLATQHTQKQKQQEQQQQNSQQQQQFCQVAQDNKDALATHETTIETTIDIQATTTATTTTTTLPNDLQIPYSNCYSRSAEINRDENQQQQQKPQLQRRRRRRHWRPDPRATRGRSRSSSMVAGATIAGIPCQRLHEMLLQARAALATRRGMATNQQQLSGNGVEQQQQQVQDEQQRIFVQPQPLARPWRLSDNVASAIAVVPATMSAAILANLSATSAAAYQYLGQHYKHYSQSFSFYAASSVILMLCYLTTLSTAAATQSETGALDKHPM